MKRVATASMQSEEIRAELAASSAFIAEYNKKKATFYACKWLAEVATTNQQAASIGLSQSFKELCEVEVKMEALREKEWRANEWNRSRTSQTGSGLVMREFYPTEQLPNLASIIQDAAHPVEPMCCVNAARMPHTFTAPVLVAPMELFRCPLTPVRRFTPPGSPISTSTPIPHIDIVPKQLFK